MPSPSSSLATLRPDLASFFEFDLEMEKAGYIGQLVMPVMEVAQASGNFGIISIEQLLAERDTARSPGGGYSRGKWTFDDVSYVTKEHGAEEPIDDNEVQMYKEYFDVELVSTSRAFAAVLRNQERRVASICESLTAHPVTNEWDDANNATPITDVEAAITAIYDATGLWANALAINKKVFRNLRNCAQIIDRINSAGAGNPSKPSDVTVEMLKAVFDLEHIFVGGSSKNTAAEGQSATPGQIWSSEYATVLKVANGMDMKEPCFGRTFHWSQDGSTIGGTVETYRDEVVRGDVVRVRHQVQEKTLYTDAAYLLSNITT